MSSPTSNNSQYKSAKRIAREAKMAKKQSNMRTLEERRIEVEKIYTKLHEVGIYDDLVAEFKKISDDYINFGYSCSGSIKIEELGRVLLYSLTIDKRIPVSSMLRAI